MVSAGTEKGKEFAVPKFGGGVGQKEIAIFTRQFSVMIDAGLPLVQCLEILGSQQKNRAFQKVLFQVRQDVESGSTLADSLRKHPKVFNNLYCNMIAAGESGGILDTILQRLAQYIEKAVKLKSAVRSAMIYPVAVITIAVGVVLKIPVLGDLMRKISVARFCRTLGTLIQSGVPILEGLEITARTSGNAIVEDAIMATRKSIEEGKTIAGPLEDTGVFPSMVVQMISVGEQTGALVTMLSKIADFYEDEVYAAVENLLALPEPLMIPFLGVMIGGIVISMYMPMFRLLCKIAYAHECGRSSGSFAASSHVS